MIQNKLKRIAFILATLALNFWTIEAAKTSLSEQELEQFRDLNCNKSEEYVFEKDFFEITIDRVELFGNTTD